MAKEVKFYICKHCGNLVEMVQDSGANPVCCGEPMQLIVHNTQEAAVEKHIPVAKVDGNIVKVDVGSVAHPMTDAHYIGWVYLQTDKGSHKKMLNPGEAPQAVFALADEVPVAVYAYCNLHGLWKAAL